MQQGVTCDQAQDDQQRFFHSLTRLGCFHLIMYCQGLACNHDETGEVRRHYVDFARLYRFVLAGAFFVTRAKSNIQSSRLESRPVEPGTGVRIDQVIWLSLPKSIEHYPDRLRRVSYRDPESGKALVFLTNNFDLPPPTIAQLYKSRWRVELFFKWVKQNLRIKHFFGASDNAVET